MNSMWHGRIPKKEADEGIRNKQTVMTIITHPTCTIALHIYFSFVIRERAPKPPKHRGPERALRLYNASIACYFAWRAMCKILG